MDRAQIDNQIIGQYAEVLEAIWDQGGDVFGLSADWLSKDELLKRDPDAFKKMGKQLYEDKQVNFPLKNGGRSDPFTIGQMQGKINDYVAAVTASPDATKPLPPGFDKLDLNQIYVPKDKIDKVVSTLDGVKAKHTGLWNNLGDYIMGFFKWLGNLLFGSEKKGLFETIAEMKAPQVERDARAAVLALGEKDPEIGKLLGRPSGYTTKDGREVTYLDYIAGTARNTALTTGGAKITDPLVSRGSAKDKVKDLPRIINENREGVVRNRVDLVVELVLTKQGEQSVSDRLKFRPMGMNFDIGGIGFARSVARRFGENWANDGQISKIRTAVGDEVAQAWTNPEYADELRGIYAMPAGAERDAKAKEFIKKRSDAALDRLAAADPKMAELLKTEAGGKTLRDTISEEVGAGLGPKLNDLPIPFRKEAVKVREERAEDKGKPLKDALFGAMKKRAEEKGINIASEAQMKKLSEISARIIDSEEGRKLLAKPGGEEELANYVMNSLLQPGGEGLALLTEIAKADLSNPDTHSAIKAVFVPELANIFRAEWNVMRVRLGMEPVVAAGPVVPVPPVADPVPLAAVGDKNSLTEQLFVELQRMDEAKKKADPKYKSLLSAEEMRHLSGIAAATIQKNRDLVTRKDYDALSGKIIDDALEDPEMKPIFIKQVEAYAADLERKDPKDFRLGVIRKALEDDKKGDPTLLKALVKSQMQEDVKKLLQENEGKLNAALGSSTARAEPGRLLDVREGDLGELTRVDARLRGTIQPGLGLPSLPA